MRDFLRLRQQLRLLLVCAPLAACGPKASDQPADPVDQDSIGHEVDEEPARMPEMEWPDPGHGCGVSGLWCGSIEQAAAEVAGMVEDGCPERFERHSLRFFVDEVSEAAQQAAPADACCYSYKDGCVVGRPLLQIIHPLDQLTALAGDPHRARAINTVPAFRRGHGGIDA